MLDDLHHAPEVRVLFVTSQHLKFPITCDQQHRWRIFANVIDGRHVVNDCTSALDAAFFSDRKVCDGVAAVGNQSGQVVSVGAVCGQPSLIHANHAG